MGPNTGPPNCEPSTLPLDQSANSFIANIVVVAVAGFSNVVHAIVVAVVVVIVVAVVVYCLPVCDLLQ